MAEHRPYLDRVAPSSQGRAFAPQAPFHLRNPNSTARSESGLYLRIQAFITRFQISHLFSASVSRLSSVSLDLGGKSLCLLRPRLGILWRMNIPSPSNNSGPVSSDVQQALLLKKQVKLEEAQKQSLIESAQVSVGHQANHSCDGSLGQNLNQKA